MKYFAEILEQFTMGQKIFVLILLLAFSSGTFLVSQYLKRSDCQSLVEENKNLIDDFVKVSSMVRELKLEVLACTEVAVEPLNIVSGASNTVEAAEEAFETYLDTSKVDIIFEDDKFEEILQITDQHRPR